MTITGLVNVVFPAKEEPIFARLDRCPSLPALSSGTVLWSGRRRSYPPRARTGPKAELPFMEKSSPWRNNILLGLAPDYLLMEGHLSFRHPCVNQFMGVLSPLLSSPVFPIWLVSAIYCISPINIKSGMLHPLLSQCFKDHCRFFHLSAESEKK